MGDLMVRPDGAITEHGFGETSVRPYAETAAAAVAAREKAAVEARYIIAMRMPRKIEQFRLAILDECKRPGFAAVARYRKPVGKELVAGEWKQKYVEGPSIRFIEAAVRAFRNITPEIFTVFDSPDLRIVRVSVTDLESNICYATEIQIGKTVEKRGQKKGKDILPPDGREVIGQRLNSYGEPTFLVRATEDETLIKQSALCSKAIRTLAQRLLPGDVVEECMQTVIATQEQSDAQDPAAALRKLIDGFHALNVEPADLETWAGKPLDRLQPKDLKELRAMWVAMGNGEATWEEYMEAKDPTGSTEAANDVAAKKLANFRKNETEVKQAPETATPSPEAQETAQHDKPRSTGRMKL